jgi:hypothetical protein
MKLYPGKIPMMAQEIATALTVGGDIEIREEQRNEVELDVASVLREYVRVEREVTDQARDLIARRELDFTSLSKLKQRIADERGFGLEEDAVEYIVVQVIEMLLHSVHVEEVFAEDNVLRRKMAEVLRRYMNVDNDLDKEVRRRIKNLQEGTTGWEIEYRRLMEDLRRTKRAPR